LFGFVNKGKPSHSQNHISSATLQPAVIPEFARANIRDPETKPAKYFDKTTTECLIPNKNWIPDISLT
jgi:hypothetical protein